MTFPKDIKVAVVIENPLLGVVVLHQLREIGFKDIWLESNSSKAYQRLLAEDDYPTKLVVFDLPHSNRNLRFVHELRKLDRHSKTAMLVLHSLIHINIGKQIASNGVAESMSYPFDGVDFDFSLQSLHGKFLDKIPFRF